MLTIGKYQAENNLFLAPMAGVTDQPFRKLCKQFGAGWVVSEMVWSQSHLYNTNKTLKRIEHSDEPSPKIVQIAGGDARSLAETALYNVNLGAEIIDINMGCPAKKVCNKAAGSALMRDEKLVAEILHATVNAVNVPVTLKIRTGWDETQINALNIAKIAEDSGIQSIAIHGRTRSQKYMGFAEYDTIAEVKQSLSIPVIANGDINTPQDAKTILDYTKADGLMIGRAAQGRPWIFQQISTYLESGATLPDPDLITQRHAILSHLQSLHQFYGDFMGARIARKHIGWYLDAQHEDKIVKRAFNKITESVTQMKYLENYFSFRI
jgi:tRNA-dihydrouridine synthase B